MRISRNIALLKWFNFFSSFSLHAAVAILYFAEITDSYATAMAIFSVQALLVTVLDLPTGILSDLLGRKWVLVIGALSAVVSMLFYAFADSTAQLFAGAVLHGLTIALYSGNNEALTYDTLKELGTESEYAHIQGRISSANQFAMATAVLAGSLVVGISLRYAFFLSLIPYTLAFLIGLFVIEPKVRTESSKNPLLHLREALREFKGNSTLQLLSVGRIFTQVFWVAKYQFFPVFIQTLWPVWAIGIARAIAHASSAMGMYFAGKLSKRQGPFRFLFFSESMSFAVGTFVLAAPTVLSPLINSVSTFFVGSGSVTHIALLQKEYSDRHRATMNSILTFIGGVLLSIVGYGLGYFADLVGVRVALLTFQMLSLPVLVVYWLLYTRSKEELAAR